MALTNIIHNYEKIFCFLILSFAIVKKESVVSKNVLYGTRPF